VKGYLAKWNDTQNKSLETPNLGSFNAPFSSFKKTITSSSVEIIF